MADTNPFDQFDQGPAPADTSAAPVGAAGGNPFDQFDAGSPANPIPQTQAAVDQVPDSTLPEVTVTAKRPGPPSTWGETLAAIPTTIGARIESKLAGVQDFKGQGEYADARKTFWQSMILPGAVREAKDAGIALTDHPDVVDNAKRLGIRPDVFARDWPKYVNMSEEDLRALQREQTDRMQEGQQAAQTGAARRTLAVQTAEAYKPETGSGWSPKSIVFSAATGIPDILAGAAGTVAGGPVGGIAVTMAQLAPEQYSTARNAGADHQTASTYAALSSVAQAVPAELPVVNVLSGGTLGRSILRKAVGDAVADSAVGKVAGTMATQGGAQAIIQTLQEGIDAGIIDQKTSVKDALERIAQAGLSGAVVGAPFGAAHAVMGRGRAGAGKPTVLNEPGMQAAGSAEVPEAATPAAARAQPAESAAAAPAEAVPEAAAPRAQPGGDTHAALEALQDKTVSPPQMEHLENLGLARRNDLGEPMILPAGRRALAEFQSQPRSEGTAATEAPAPAEKKPTGDALVDRIASEPDLRAELERMKGETGWAEVGGRMIRTPGSDESQPDKISRTKWIPNAEWWRERPKGLTEDQTHLAVDKALNGGPMGQRERAMVSYMVDTADKARAAPQEAFTTALEHARQDTETAPTEAQKKAGNYQKGELPFAPGLTFTMENPKGSTRSGTGPQGPWSREMAHDYGYLNRTEGNDGDHVDAFLTGKPDTGHSFVVNQVDPATGKFDEHKLVLGANTLDEAKQTYLANYPKGWKGLGSIVEMPTERLKGWLARADMSKPAEASMARSDVARRKAVGEMSPEEMRQSLLTHELTGLPNRRAYEEAPKLSHQVAVDVDSLKWVNDTMGHEHGDELLRAVGNVLKEQTGQAYHVSGDEFVVQAKSEAEAHDIMREVGESLAGHTLEATGPEGKKVELAGLGLSYGVGRSLHEADRNLSAHKALREARGERAARGEKPPGATVRARSREGLEAESAVAEPRVEHARVREDQAEYFSTAAPVPEAGGGLAVGERARGSRDVQSGTNLQLFSNAEAPAASRPLTGTHTGLTETGRFASGIKVVKRWEDAAHIFAPLRKSPQEHIMALVVDAKGRPLAVIRHQIGSQNAAGVVPHVLVGAIGKVEGAAGVWFGHNHPSGNLTQSSADELITNRLHGLLRGSGIDPLGMVVVTPGGTKASYFHPTMHGSGSVPGGTTAASRAGKRTAVPVLERKFTRIPSGTKAALASPAEARVAVDNALEAGHKSGVLLLDSGGHLVSTLPMDPREMAPLRTGDTRSGMLHVMRAAEDSNASSAITFGHERDSAAVANLGAMLTESGVRVLDTFLHNGKGDLTSTGGALTRDTGFYSRREPETRASLEQQFMNRDDKFWGVKVHEDEGWSEFKKSGYSGVQCTGFACAILHKLGAARVKVFGFDHAENPGSAIARDAGGHDFAVVDGRFIVDPWLSEGFATPMGKDDLPTRGVYDLENPADQKAIDRLYGDQDAWRDMTPQMPHAARPEVEKAVRTAIRDSGMRAAPDFPNVHVHEDYTTLPADLRDKVIQDRGENTVGAVYDPQTGDIHMIAENLGTPREAVETLWHEAVGHHGLRLIMDADRYAKVMDGVWNAMPDRVRQTAERNGLDVGQLAQRRLAAEEVIAYAAGRHLAGATIDKQVRPLWQRALGAVKAFVARMTGKPFTSDSDIAGLIRESKRALETGSAVQRMGALAESRRAPIFYSPTLRAVEDSRQAKASPEQWLATIRKTPGIKPEELQWMNLEPWLKEQKGQVTREQLADYVRANKLELEETTLGGLDEEAQTDAEREQTHHAEAIRAMGGEVHLNPDGSLYAVTYRREAERQFEYFPAGDDREEEGGERMTPEMRRHVEALAEISDQVSQESGSRDYGFPHGAQYEEFTLPKGENYKELLIRLPSNEVSVQERLEAAEAAVRAQASAERIDESFSSRGLREFALDVARGQRPESMLSETMRPLARELREAYLERRRVGDGDVYKSPHWEPLNVLAHVRTKDRVSADGKKVLFLEELQSDWHQQGREHGYNTQETRARRTSAEMELAKIRPDAVEAVRHAGLLGFDSEAEALAAIRGHTDWKDRWPDVPAKDQELLDDYRQVAADASKPRKEVPNAPLKTSWPMLIMKRMIRTAAEGGYERIAWTTGEQQADRYNLDKHIDSIEWEPKGDGRLVTLSAPGHTYRFSTDADGRVSKSHTASAHGLEGNHLSDLVGGELAKKIATEGTGALEGQDLRVGGHGQRGFYDDILPRETNKLIRKYGAQVGDVHLPRDMTGMDWAESRPVGVASEPGAHGEVRWYIKMADGSQSGTWLSRENAEEAVTKFQKLYDEEPRTEAQHGFDITPQMRDEALSQGFPMFWKKPSQQTLGLKQGQGPAWYEGVRRAVEYLHENPVTRDFRKLINPTKLSEEAKRTAVLARAALGNLAHSTFETQEHLEQFSRQIDRLKPEEQLEMMDAIEHGVPQPNADLQPVADALRKQLDTWRDKVRGLGTGALDNFIENYFPHYWTQPGQAQRMVATIMGRRPLRGPASFLKMRTIPTIREGMQAGLTPLTINPLVMTLLKVREMQRFVSGVKMMQEFKDSGLAQFLPATKPMPEGWAEIKDNIARVRQWSEEEQGFIERGRYIMPEDGARLINNHVGRSVLTDFAPTHVLRLGGNLLNAMQLGFSAFHLGFTTLDASISKNALGIEQLIRGEVGRAATSFAQGFTPVGAIANVTRGYKLMRAYADPAGATPEMAKIVQALQAAGGRVAMDRYFMAISGVNPFRGVGIRSLVQDVRGALKGPEPVKGVARAVGNYPVEYATRAWREVQGMTKTMPLLQVPFEIAGRTVRASTAWIMEHLVPMQKLGVFSDMAQDYLRRNPTATSDQVARAMQSAWDSVDNRLGEMVYDNVFWNRTFKDANHLAVRAVGWNLGTIREIGGAPIDALAAIDKLARTGKLSADDIGHKIPYVLAMTATTAALGATLNYLFTGQGPQELKDYFFPRTGGTTNRGTPQRVSLPSYVKDVYEYSQHPSTTVANKLNPIFSVLSDIWRNQDYFGSPISEPEASPLTQAGQRAAYALREATPFSIQGRAHIEGSDAEGVSGAIKRTLPFIGVTPAPGYVTSPEQLERRDRYEAEDKYSREIKYRLNKAMAAHDQESIKSLTEQYVQSRRRVKELQMQMNVDKAKAAAARRQNVTSMRQQGYPATAGLLASLPLEPDREAREFFRNAAGSQA